MNQNFSRNLIIGLVILFYLNQFSPAETITVNTTGDEIQIDGQCTLREALANANNDNKTAEDCAAGNGDDVIDLTNISGTILLEDQLEISSSLHLLGPGAEVLALDGHRKNRIFMIDEGVTVEIDNVTVTHGQISYRSGAGLWNQGALTLTNSIISGNFSTVSAQGGGGGIYNTGHLTLINSTVSENFLLIMVGVFIIAVL